MKMLDELEGKLMGLEGPAWREAHDVLQKVKASIILRYTLCGAAGAVIGFIAGVLMAG